MKEKIILKKLQLAKLWFEGGSLDWGINKGMCKIRAESIEKTLKAFKQECYHELDENGWCDENSCSNYWGYLK